MKLCTRVLTSDGEVRELDEHERNRILETEIIDNFAKKGLKTLAYAYKDMDSDHWENLQAENNNFVNEKDREIVE
jgi:magnesium-transporting ATPase (P-type)